MVGLVLIGIALWGAWTFPVASVSLTASLLLYVVTSSRWPAVWLIVVPVALAALDLTYWSGRVFFNEFDLVLLTTLGAGLLRRQSGFASSDRVVWAVAAIVAVYETSTIWIGLGGSSGFSAFADVSSLSEVWQETDYYQSTNALREGKGPIWALLLLPMLIREAQTERHFQRWCSAGIFAALLLSGAIVLWERVIFTGLFDFNHPYRVSGNFFSMHTGGAALDAFLVMALPFTAAGYLLWRDRRAALIGAGASLLCVYAIYVTYSRANYPAVAAVALVLGVGWLIQRNEVKKALRHLTLLRVTGATAATVLLAGLVLGDAIKARFSTTLEDSQGRLAHYASAVTMMENQSGRQIFGLGKGRFPVVYYFEQNLAGNHLATAFLHREVESDTAFVRFSKSDTGGSLFLRQRFDPTTESRIRLHFTARTVGKRAEYLHVEFCERHMLKFRAECHDEGTTISATSGEWETFNRQFNVGSLGQRGIGPIRTPVDISVMNRGFHEGLEVDAVQVFTMDGRSLLKNPEFDQGLDH